MVAARVRSGGMPNFGEALRRRLAGPLPGLDAQLRMAPQPRPGWDPHTIPPGLRDAAGLLLVYPHDGEWHLPLTVRASHLRHHTGQVSLPGGRVDEGESFADAALREAAEEVGLERGLVSLIGALTPLHIPVSRHLLHPLVGVAAARPVFQPAPAEVAHLLEVPLSRLRLPDAVRWEQRRRELPPAVMMDVPYFDVEGHRVWGATAMVLAEFLAVLDGLDATS